jgi:2-dehydro-3-deoxyphosphogalactonate aldolase
MTLKISWPHVLSKMPLIAILRGIEPREAVSIAEALHAGGFLCVEVPLNSPDALKSIAKMRAQFEGKLLVGAGTVLNTAEVADAHAAGAEFMVSPNTQPAVIHSTKDRGLLSIPGFLTPSEAFAAIEAGADALKLFPAESASPSVLRALKAVIPKSFPILPVGGITPSNMSAFVEAGAAGFGIGSALYKPGITAASVQERAAAFVNAWQGRVTI